MKVTLYTDPGCPFGFNAQRQELQLMWHYGYATEIERRMIVLAERSSTFEEIGLSPAIVMGNRERLARLYGMPMGLAPVDRMPTDVVRDVCHHRPVEVARCVGRRPDRGHRDGDDV